MIIDRAPQYTSRIVVARGPKGTVGFRGWFLNSWERFWILFKRAISIIFGSRHQSLDTSCQCMHNLVWLSISSSQRLGSSKFLNEWSECIWCTWDEKSQEQPLKYIEIMFLTPLLSLPRSYLEVSRGKIQVEMAGDVRCFGGWRLFGLAGSGLEMSGPGRFWGSMPTFQFWLRGKKRHQFSGADEWPSGPSCWIYKYMYNGFKMI